MVWTTVALGWEAETATLFLVVENGAPYHVRTFRLIAGIFDRAFALGTGERVSNLTPLANVYRHKPMMSFGDDPLCLKVDHSSHFVLSHSDIDDQGSALWCFRFAVDSTFGVCAWIWSESQRVWQVQVGNVRYVPVIFTDARFSQRLRFSCTVYGRKCEEQRSVWHVLKTRFGGLQPLERLIRMFELSITFNIPFGQLLPFIAASSAPDFSPRYFVFICSHGFTRKFTDMSNQEVKG